MPPLIGRPPFILTPLSAFTVGYDGKPAIIPYEHEFAYDDLGDKSLGYIQYNAIGVVPPWSFVSTCRDINVFLTSLKNTGLFENAISGVVSKELTYFLYNNDNRSVIFNNKLVYPENFIFYAIRKGERYITGIQLISGAIINVCDMVAVETSTGSGVIVRKPATGTLLPDASVVDGDSYIVEFFDSTKRLIARDVFYAEYSATFTGDTTSVGIKSLHVITTRNYVGKENAAYLYIGENINQLDYSLILEYNNGDTKDVTHEYSNIQKTGWESITTTNLTGDNPFSITFSYQVLGVAPAVTTINVHVISDVEADIYELLPVYSISGLSVISRRYFAMMSDYSFYEISSKLADDQDIADYALPTTTGVLKPITAKFKIGQFGQTDISYNYSIKLVDELLSSSSASILRYQYSTSVSPFENKYGRRIITTAGTHLSIDAIPSAALFARNTDTPSHFRIRTLDGKYITDNIIMTYSADFARKINTDLIVADKATPVLIEFIKITGTIDDPSYNIKITKCIVAYFN